MQVQLCNIIQVHGTSSGLVYIIEAEVVDVGYSQIKLSSNYWYHLM